MPASYDVVLIRPPVIHDFRRRPIFPGALGPSTAAVQFTKVPIGILIFQSFEFTIDQKEKYGFYSSSEAGFERVRLEMDRAIVKEADAVAKLENPRERTFRIVTMRKNLDKFLATRRLNIPEESNA